MPGQGFRLDAAIADVYGDLRLAPVLRRLLRHSGRLTGSAAGSISLVDAAHGHYVKAAEVGARCRLGQRFPLDEGATGRAFGRRRPVVIPDYGRLRAGHLAGTDPASRGAAVAVPVWWRGEVIAVNVVFAPTADDLTPGAVDDLEALTQTAAAAIVLSGRGDPSLGALIARRVPAPEEGALRPGPPFSPREAEVLALLREGLTDREIAARLVVSPKTVEKHVAAVLRKTGTTRRTAAVVVALDNGWIPPYR
ncbi:LuxR C-terminal-related transcriptional regulator [Actinoplanes sp. M2I2]|uniref:helix-turn-helix transcriptional regulator n=1 Tax=Actinoplanes sp. M2I2 TaxID=1734444 RepID=UPI0020208146|nr:LuxR C-terminal-related transcriptional regulator [Actinoplanes sp. M2I2]